MIYRWLGNRIACLCAIAVTGGIACSEDERPGTGADASAEPDGGSGSGGLLGSGGESAGGAQGTGGTRIDGGGSGGSLRDASTDSSLDAAADVMTAPDGSGPTGDGGSTADATPADGSGSDSGGGACQSDADCTGQKCHPLTHTCHECLFHTDCAFDHVCDSGTCRQSASCGPGDQCNIQGLEPGSCSPEYRRCVECFSFLPGSSNCPNNRPCWNGFCETEPLCETSLDCALGEVCSDGACVECAQDSDCAPSEACVFEQCRPACGSDNDCTPLGLLCTSGGCVPCTVDSQCPDRTVCERGECRLATCDADRNGYCMYGPWPDSHVRACNGWRVGASTECAEDDTCVDHGTGAECVDQVCVPDSGRCFTDERGHGWRRCAHDGTGFIQTDFCPPDLFCGGTDGCVPCSDYSGFPRCSMDGKATQTCDFLGDIETSTPCDPGEACIDFVCNTPPPSCQPGDRVCSRVGLWECVAGDGGAMVYSFVETCPEHCWEGECVPLNGGDGGL